MNLTYVARYPFLCAVVLQRNSALPAVYVSCDEAPCKKTEKRGCRSQGVPLAN